MPVSVVHVRRKKFTHYVGRACAEFDSFGYGNPFVIGRDGSREEVIAKFAAYWYDPLQSFMRAWVLKEIPEDAILGCWCAPKACHGDIIAGYLNWKRREKTLWD